MEFNDDPEDEKQEDGPEVIRLMLEFRLSRGKYHHA